MESNHSKSWETDMSLERADRLSTPPVVGQFYLVPTVYYEWFNKIRHWPIVGAIHNDADRFFLKADHYHLDVRFTPAWALNMRPFAAPLIELPNCGPLPSIKFRAIRCHRLMPVYPHHDRKEIIGIQKDYAGQQCTHGKGGWICPHRKFSLGSLEPIDGVITCPLHGLQINSKTGRVISNISVPAEFA